MKHPHHEENVHALVVTGELVIDDDGRVWRVMKRTADRWTRETKTTPCARVRAESRAGDGYLQVRAMRDRQRVAAAAHRLVWFHFRGPIPDGKTVNHKNGRKDDNRPDNLEIATYSEQRRHAIDVLGAGHADVRGSKNPKAQITESDVRAMRRQRAAGVAISTIAIAYGVTRKNVSAICNGRTWRHVA